MKRENNERKAFWFLLVWFVVVSFVHQPHLSAQDDDMFVVEDDAGAAEEQKAGAEPAAKAANEEDGQPGDGDFADDAPEGEGGESDEEFSEELPALSADPVELLAKVAGIAKAGKHKDVIGTLGDHEDAVAESKELLAIYVEALINLDKPDWNKINRYAKMLGTKDKTSSLADYAQGMYFLNAKKPDAGKAMQFLSKAKSAKKPYPAAASAYYMALVKRFWMIGLGVVLLPVVVIIKKKKAAKKAMEIDLGFENSGESAPTLDDASLNSAPATDNNAGESATVDPSQTPGPVMVEEDKKATTTVKKIKKIIKKKVVAKVPADQSEPVEADPVESDTLDSDIAEPESVAASEPEETVAEPEFEPVPEVSRKEVVLPVEEPKQVKEPAPQEKPSAQPYRPGFGGASTSFPASFTSVQAKHNAEIEKIRDLTRPGRPSTVPADAELDNLWSSLSRKAMQGRIGPQYRRESDLAGSFSSSPSTRYDSYPEPEMPAMDMHVTIDLSDESLRDDLVGKLKMMAISDAELRELFAQKNARHIPHLIEYVLTRPEPLRLSFVARELGNYEDPAVIDTLASLLYHDDDRVALAAIQGLEKTGRVTAVLHLCPFLKSEIPVLAQAARSALANFGAVKILQAFRDLPSYPDSRIREAGVFVLSRMTGNAVEELLKRMLQDESLDIRKSVILAMSYQKNPAYIDVLREFFRTASEDDKTLARKAIVYLQGFMTKKK